jgi:TRAP-type C4-dicarboxylate transport system permease small subunit
MADSLHEVKLAGQIALIALVALGLTLLPNGGGVLKVALTLLSVTFFAAIAFLGYRLWHQFRFELETLDDRTRAVFYGSVGLALLTFTASSRMVDSGGFGALAWIALLGICSYGLYWVWTQYRGLA